MIVVIHIVLAISSLIYTSLLFIAPSNRRFKINYALVTATLLSGTLLIFQTGSGLLQACMSGLFYLSMVSVGTLLAHKKYNRLSKQYISAQD
jgi:hypothetical protein